MAAEYHEQFTELLAAERSGCQSSLLPVVQR
jgi:hypothetical protein